MDHSASDANPKLPFPIRTSHHLWFGAERKNRGIGCLLAAWEGAQIGLVAHESKYRNRTTLGFQISHHDLIDQLWKKQNTKEKHICAQMKNLNKTI